MFELHKQNIRKAAEIGGIYEKYLQKELENIDIDLKKALSDIINEFAKDFELTISNSVHKDVNLYDITSRVKKKHSLAEKLIQKQMIIDFENITDEDAIRSKILEVDDLIGIKILLSLKKDCQQMYSLLVKKSDILKEKNIEILFIGSTVMLNGREIYKLKGKFNEKYNFELQIKSKIDSVWGDLEHSIFYKDYRFNYTKENNKSLMIEIGELLDKVESMMHCIRSNQERLNFDDEINKMKFSQELQDKYRDFIICHFGSESILSEINDIIYEFNNHVSGIKINEKYALEFDLESQLQKNFYDMVSTDSILGATTYIYLNSNNIVINDDIVVDVVCKFLKFCAKRIDTEIITIDTELISEIVIESFRNNNNFLRKSIFNKKKYEEFAHLIRYLNIYTNDTSNDSILDPLGDIQELIENVSKILYNEMFIESPLLSDDDDDINDFMSYFRSYLDFELEKNKNKLGGE